MMRGEYIEKGEKDPRGGHVGRGGGGKEDRGGGMSVRRTRGNRREMEGRQRSNTSNTRGMDHRGREGGMMLLGRHDS